MYQAPGHRPAGEERIIVEPDHYQECHLWKQGIARLECSIYGNLMLAFRCNCMFSDFEDYELMR